MKPTTKRQYAAVTRDFLWWCDLKQLKHPVPLGEIAQYLDICMRLYGPTTVGFRASAVAQYYRSQGWPFDTKFPAIKSIRDQALKRAEKARGGAGRRFNGGRGGNPVTPLEKPHKGGKRVV